MLHTFTLFRALLAITPCHAAFAPPRYRRIANIRALTLFRRCCYADAALCRVADAAILQRMPIRAIARCYFFSAFFVDAECRCRCR